MRKNKTVCGEFNRPTLSKDTTENLMSGWFVL